MKKHLIWYSIILSTSLVSIIGIISILHYATNQTSFFYADKEQQQAIIGVTITIFALFLILSIWFAQSIYDHLLRADNDKQYDLEKDLEHDRELRKIEIEAEKLNLQIETKKAKVVFLDSEIREKQTTLGILQQASRKAK